MKKILIAGMLPHDSGKTTMGLKLIEILKERGVKIGISKPVSGFNGWYQYEYLKKSVSMNLLVGEDLYRLHYTTNTQMPIEMEGPLVSLLVPPDISKLGWRFTYYDNILENVLLQTIIVRITECSEEIPKTIHYIIEYNKGKLSDYYRVLLRKFFNKIRTVKLGINSLDELYVLLNETGPLKIESCIKKLMRALEEKKTDVIITESFNDAVAPTNHSLDTDYVILVSPVRVALYEGKKYKKAFEVIDGRNPWQFSTRKIISLLKPRLSLELPPFHEKEFRKVVEKLVEIVLAD